MNNNFRMKAFGMWVASAAITVTVAQSLSGNDTPGTGKAAMGPRELFNDPAALFKWLDTDKDGKLSREEFQRILNVTGWPGGSAGSTGTEGEGPAASSGTAPAKADTGK
jgi:hypothetical protein